MKAAVVEDYGSPVVVRDVPEPVAGEGEILIRVAAASLNGFDIAVASGMLKGMVEHQFPVVLGRDFAGTVEGMGGGQFAAGEQVFGQIAKADPLGASGSFAELLATPYAAGVGRVPAGLDLPSAATLGVAGLAAVASAEATEPAPGKTVLVSGAPGGVGSFAIQLLAAKGARVIATAKPGEASDFVLELGASGVVDYEADLAAQVRAIAPGGVDGVVHLAGDPMALADLLVPGGRLASTLGAGADAFEGRDIIAVAVMAVPTREALESLADLLAGGSIYAAITRTYALEDAPRAFAEFSGTLGKAVVTPP